ncbi:Peroxisomal membrane protein [Lachnellula subtilissima]|uniref:Peroxisomal membrane protein n=1 Tax=Lachnellula subtilissima TaxID=602034 RepID=A0A8H8RMH3_9HELO|nr:Peroxisomal membrane protein [Lachnellula subtilissima]
MVADSLVYHPSVAHYLNSSARLPSEIAPFEAMKKQFGLARKLMRFGKFVEHFKAAAVAADSKSLDPVIKYCAVGRQLGYAGYLSFDAATVLDAAGIRKFEAAKRFQREAYKCWAVGLFFSTASGLYSLYNLRLQTSKIDKENGEGVVAAKRIEKYVIPSSGAGSFANFVSRERAATNLQLLSDLCDLTVPTTAIGLANFDDGLVGLAGTVSSLIGVYSTWKKTA